MFRMKIETDNAAFDENPEDEIIRILQYVKDRIDLGSKEGIIHDINGNPVGNYHFKRR